VAGERGEGMKGGDNGGGQTAATGGKGTVLRTQEDSPEGMWKANRKIRLGGFCFGGDKGERAKL